MKVNYLHYIYTLYRRNKDRDKRVFKVSPRSKADINILRGVAE